MELFHPYISVLHGEERTYGGSQMLSPDEATRNCGCGLVAALDTLLYLQRWHGWHTDFLGDPREEVFAQPRYELWLQTLRQRYLPLPRPFGINGLGLAAGMGLLFRQQHIPLTARWQSTRRALWTGIEDMLRRDIPVILSVGPNFPLLLSEKYKATFYRRAPNGVMRPAASINGHYVTVTGFDGSWLRISSWGREYYLKKDELDEYASRHSSYLFCNILYLEEKRNRT